MLRLGIQKFLVEYNRESSVIIENVFQKINI